MLHPPKSVLVLLAALALPLVAAAPASASAAHVTASAAAATGSDGTSAAETYGWGTPTGGDEFDGTALDTTTWEPYAGAGNAGQGTRDPAQITVSGGVASIDGTSAGTTGGFSDRTNHRYGRWETRMRVPSGDARYHPVLLLWPDGSVPWPQGGEIDYAETTTAAKDMSFFLHYSAANQQTYAQTPVDITQWHDYAVEWTSAGVTGYIDGTQVFRDTTPAHQPPAAMHSSIQLDWFPSGSSATTPSSLQVDWTRFYPV